MVQVFSLVLFFDKGYGRSPRVGCKSYGTVSYGGIKSLNSNIFTARTVTKKRLNGRKKQ